jgi:hypothetical protein
MPERRRIIAALIVFVVAVLSVNACSVPKVIITEPTVTSAETAPDEGVLVAETEFRVTLPEALVDGQKMGLEIVDEVSGLALNVQRNPMERVSDTQYVLKLPVLVGSVLKYRYIQDGKDRAIEYTRDGKQVRYRMVRVANPGVVEDIISAWNDRPFRGPYGRIQGRISEKGSNLPVPGCLVAAGGQQTLSASDGSFILDGLPPGKHNLVIYSLDGSYPAFQQEAEVAVDSSTPADIQLDPAKIVNVTFLVTASTDIPDGIPIRLVGNIYPLGNTFADLRGGVSTIASRAPTLSFQGDHQYRITVRLPEGLDLRYKYTLGDGFWNAERGQTSKLNTRQLIVPATDTTINETLGSFSTPGMGPVTFSVSVSAGLAAGETLSIQFNPYGWTEPIPMWPMGGNRWVYILYSPLDKDIIREAGYRFCKNDQCGLADDATTMGADVPGKIFTPSAEPQLLTDDVKQWAWQPESESATTVTSEEIKPRSADFITGVELLPDYHPSWQAYLGPAFEQIQTIRSKVVILSPTWHFATANPPVLSDVPGQDPSWYDLSRMAVVAREKGLRIAVHPALAYYQPYDLWWMEAVRDDNWWQTWFDRYETFLLNYADFSNQAGAEMLILGDSSLRPALPGGVLFDGSPSGVPDYASERWATIIANVRAHFPGKIVWRIDYPSGVDSVPDFVASVDQLYVVLSGRLGDFEDPQKDVIRPAAQSIIENDIRLIRDRFDKPLLLGISYPSAVGAASGCVLSGDACLPAYVLEQAGVDMPAVQQSLDEQTELYNGILEAVNQSDWLAGVVASGYYPAVAIQDKSISIRGKPAMDVIWFWFDRLVGAGQ